MYMKNSTTDILVIQYTNSLVNYNTIVFFCNLVMLCMSALVMKYNKIELKLEACCDTVGRVYAVCGILKTWA